MRRYSAVLGLVCLLISLLCCAPQQAEAVVLYLTFQTDGTFAGVQFDERDVVRYDTLSGIATLFFDGSQHFLPGNSGGGIDAIEVLANGHLLLSTVDRARLPGLSEKFHRDDVIDYDPVSRVATILMRGSDHFSATNENVDIIDRLADGSLLLSTSNDALFNGILFGADDIFRFDPAANATSLFFDGDSIFQGHVNIDAFDVTAGNRYLLSVSQETETLKNGTKVNDADLILYDPSTGFASIYLDHDDFPDWRGKHRDIRGVDSEGPPIPEPATAALLVTGVLGAGLSRRRWPMPF